MNKFNGISWYELGEEWNLVNPDEIDEETGEDKYEEVIKNYIYDNYRKNLQIVRDMRNFLKVVIKRGKHIFENTKLFKGLSKIKDDETFIKYFCILLGYMWV